MVRKRTILGIGVAIAAIAVVLKTRQSTTVEMDSPESIRVGGDDSDMDEVDVETTDDIAADD